MIDQEIKRLARKYAEQKNTGVNFENDAEREFVIDEWTTDVADVLQWLTKTHCIVNREEAKKEYDDAKLFADSLEKDTYEYGYYRGTQNALSKLFRDSIFDNPKQ